MNTEAQAIAQVHVQVTFAVASGPYNHRYPANATIATVLQDALAFFDLSSDGTTRYYVVFNGTEQNGSETIGSLIGQVQSLKLSMRTETISG